MGSVLLSVGKAWLIQAHRRLGLFFLFFGEKESFALLVFVKENNAPLSRLCFLSFLLFLLGKAKKERSMHASVCQRQRSLAKKACSRKVRNNTQPSTSSQARLPAELKHINKRRKRN